TATCATATTPAPSAVSLNARRAGSSGLMPGPARSTTRTKKTPPSATAAPTSRMPRSRTSTKPAMAFADQPRRAGAASGRRVSAREDAARDRHVERLVVVIADDVVELGARLHAVEQRALRAVRG